MGEWGPSIHLSRNVCLEGGATGVSVAPRVGVLGRHGLVKPISHVSGGAGMSKDSGPAAAHSGSCSWANARSGQTSLADRVLAVEPFRSHRADPFGSRPPARSLKTAGVASATGAARGRRGACPTANRG